MRKVKILIVEDEVIVAKDIAYYLNELGCDVIGVLIEGEDVLPFLKDDQPDIILMDITLRGQLNGVQTVHLIKEKYDIPIIFLTANTDDVSFDLAKATKPFAFIEKPFKSKQLVRTVQLLIEQIADSNEESEEEELNHFMLSDRIFVRDKGKMNKILLEDILYIEANGAYSNIVSKNKSYLLSLNLRNLETKICTDQLMRVHRSYIINIKHVDSIEENRISIHNHSIPISRTHWQAFIAKVKVI